MQTSRGSGGLRPATCTAIRQHLRLAYATSKLGLLADAEQRFAEALRLHMEANQLFASVGDPGRTGYALRRAI